MSEITDILSSTFLLDFLRGMTINFEIAGISLLLGLVAGAVLTIARLQGGVTGGFAAAIVELMRAAPTFVVMFFLLNALPNGGGLSGTMTVALSLVPYAASYVADSGVDAVSHLRAGSHLGFYLVLPNIARAFFVLVMSSSAGAAIGVPEGIAVILRQAAHLPTIGQKLALFAVGIVCFGVPLQLGFAIVRAIQRKLGTMESSGGRVGSRILLFDKKR